MFQKLDENQSRKTNAWRQLLVNYQMVYRRVKAHWPTKKSIWNIWNWRSIWRIGFSLEAKIVYQWVEYLFFKCTPDCQRQRDTRKLWQNKNFTYKWNNICLSMVFWFWFVEKILQNPKCMYRSKYYEKYVNISRSMKTKNQSSVWKNSKLKKILCEKISKSLLKNSKIFIKK